MAACTTLVTSLENAISGEFAIFNTAVEKAMSDLTRLQSSGKEVSVPDIRCRALSAMPGKGGTLSGSHRSSIGAAAGGAAALDVPVDSVIDRWSLELFSLANGAVS